MLWSLGVVVVVAAVVMVKDVTRVQVVMFSLLSVLRLHFHDQIPVRSVDIIGGEDTAVCLKAPVGLVPTVSVEIIEIVPPVEFKLIKLLVIGEHLHVVVEKEPRHVNWVEVLAPWVVRGSPEVHSQRLGLVHKFDGFVCVGVEMAYLTSV